MRTSSRDRAALGAACALLFLAASCGSATGDNEGADDATPGEGVTGGDSPSASVGAEESSSDQSGSGSESGTGDEVTPSEPPPTPEPTPEPATEPAVTEDPSGPDLVLFSLPECSVVPNGAITGDDGLTIFVAIRNSGPGTLSRLVPFEISSDSGISGGGNGAIASGSSFNAMQVSLRPEHYSRVHRFTIVADPGNEIVERSEGNNSITVSVTLPARPNGAQDVDCALG